MTRYALILLLAFSVIPVLAYNSGFQPIYQPNSPAGSNPAELYCTLNQFLNSYNSTTNSFTCATPSATVYENNTASNVGLGQGIFKQKTGVNLEFKGISCAGTATCSSNTTDITITTTGGVGGGNMTKLNDAGDVTLTSPSYPSVLFYNSNQWINKVFSINTKSAVNGNFITGINNQTGAITTQVFKVNNQTTPNGFITGINNSTGVITKTNFKDNNYSTTCSGTDKVSSVVYSNSTGTTTVTCSADQTGSGGGITTLGTDVTCTATASYCNVFTIPLTASSGNRIDVNLIGDSNTAGAAIQMRVQFDNAGNTGFCTYRTYTTATAEGLDVLAATTATDTGETVWLAGANVPMPLDIHCGFETDASPGNALIQVQAEVASTITIQKGSNYIKTP